MTIGKAAKGSREKGPARVQNMLRVLRDWQVLERHSMNDMAEIIEQSTNSLVRLIMHIIQHDSLLHHQVQQFLIDTLSERDVALSREDLGAIWEKIEEHDRMEKQILEMARALRNESWSPVHRLLLDYLLTDEAKHSTLLSQLGEFKKGMTRASGA